jgi:hypothetical protein
MNEDRKILLIKNYAVENWDFSKITCRYFEGFLKKNIKNSKNEFDFFLKFKGGVFD